MTTGVLQAKGLHKAYKKNQVLKGLDITIEPGKIYGLIGRNGAGKTTLLGILTAQNTHDAGEVSYNGEPVWENPKALADLCFSRELQTTLFYGQNNLKVRHYLQAGATFYPRWDEEYARRLMKEFGLEEKKRVSQLSKGQLSMVTILIALASGAPVTILDEPVAGLDVVARERFYQLLLEDYERTNRTFILSTHIIEEAASVFERVLILDDGRIIEDAETEELVDQFRYVSGAAEEVDRVCQGMTVVNERRMGRRKTAAVRDTAGRRAADLEGAGEVDVVRMSLQNVFVALCGHEAAE